jgi:type II secretory ATPase GspE/PulE/Tfp pilus assembly ATPase PilB-like protein
VNDLLSAVPSVPVETLPDLPQTVAALELNVIGLGPEAAILSFVRHAIALGASDLFLCTDVDGVVVQVRHLGILRRVCRLNADLGRRCLAHVKAVAGMDVAEKRRPLDGRWICELGGGRSLDVRISTVPTMYGEDCTMRLLDRETRLLNLDHLGLLQRDFNRLLAMLHGPGGLILVTGPTGSGKTTTLYACLRQLNNGQRKINTIEDPIEYALPGIRQSQVNPRLDVDFAEMLRSVLRQAPDVIMIGEVRDPQTAETAVRAANSGHLVLATLHAPIAPGAIPTLLNLGVHPHYLANALVGVVAQRLVRTLCPECKMGFDLGGATDTFAEVRASLGANEGHRLYGPVGCPACRGLGFIGRSGVFEVMNVTPALRDLILRRESLQVLRRKAIEEGLVEFRHSALIKVARGETSIEEVFRTIPAEYLGGQ